MGMGGVTLEPADRYVLISPCRNEAQYVRRTLESVEAQTVRPALWIVIDDGSTDETPAILASHAARLPWLRVVRREDRGHRAVGPGVIDAFYAGLETIDLDDFDYVCKLDVDLDLPPRYFETLIARMKADPRLGSCSGKPWFPHPKTGELVPERCGDEMSVGMTKFYRTECFREIGGFVRQVMWDGIDCHRARMLGWRVQAFDDPTLRFVHLRAMGSSQRGILTGRVRFGFGQWFMGSAPAFFLASAVFRLPSHPPVLGSLASVWGYLSSAVRGAPRYEDLEFRRYLRRYQHLALVLGKRGAIARLEREGAATWERNRQASSPAFPQHAGELRRGVGP